MSKTAIADGLQSPRVMTDAAGAILWQWSTKGNPFGEQPPASSNGFVYNLRFPGQYCDTESGLNYNVNRDYESTTGRYIQGDPIGLDGGLSTYTYVGGNPLGFVDPLGLAQSPWYVAWVPGQGAWDAATTSWENGNYGMAALYSADMLGEQVLSVLTFGQSQGAICASTQATKQAGLVFKTAHYASRLEAAGLDVAKTESVVAGEVRATIASASEGSTIGPFQGRLLIDNVPVQYNVYPLPNGWTNVGTIYPLTW